MSQKYGDLPMISFPASVAASHVALRREELCIATSI